MNEVRPQDFGAIGDGVADDTAPIELWLNEILTCKKTGILDGNYRYRPTKAWDIGGHNFGVHIEGKRRNFDGISLDPGYSLNIYASGDVFYPTFQGFKVRGSCAGPVLRIGKDDLSDAFNAAIFDGLVVNNDIQSPAGIGVMSNHVCNSFFRGITVNCGGSGRPNGIPGVPNNAYAPGLGNSLRLRQTQFCEISGSFANANIGVLITDGYSFSNNFHSMDIEEVNTAVYINSPYANKNGFFSGQYVAKNIFDCPYGQNFVNNRTCNLSPYYGGSIGNVSGIVWI